MTLFSAPAPRNFNQENVREGLGHWLQQCLCIKEMFSSNTFNTCGLVPTHLFEG